ncbi:hypothetical protein Tco_0833616 [Tanacetum coccineum]
MPVIRFHCPFVGLSGCHDGSGNGLTKSYKGDEQAITKQSLTTNLAVFDEAEVTFKRMGLWLCGVCFKMHTVRFKCHHGSSDFVPPLDCGNGIVRFVLYDLTKPSVPASSDPDHVDALGQDVYDGFTLTLLDRLLSKGLRTVKSIPRKCRLGFSRVLKGALDKLICTPDEISCWLLRETLAEPAPLSSVLEEDLETSERNIKQYDLKAKHPFKAAPTLPNIPIVHHQLVAPPGLVLDMIKSFSHGTSYGQDGLRTQHLMDCLSGATMAISDELIAFITQVVNLFLDEKCPKTLGEYIVGLRFNLWLLGTLTGYFGKPFRHPCPTLPPDGVSTMDWHKERQRRSKSRGPSNRGNHRTVQAKENCWN